MADAEEEIDRLYALPAGEFTAARNDLAKRLRREGEKEEAERVGALRKPSPPAAAVNRLVRERPADLDELIEAGDDLRAAQDELLAGGEREPLTRAAERERRLVSRLTGAASDLAGGTSAAVRQKIEDTLRAAAVDDEAREAVRGGRLDRERSPASLGPFGSAAPPQSKSRRGRTTGAKKKEKDAGDAGAEKRRRRVADLEAQLAGEEKREAEARRRLEEAEGAAHDARREADQAATRRDRAEAEEDRRRERHEQAAAKAAAIRDELEKARG